MSNQSYVFKKGANCPKSKNSSITTNVKSMCIILAFLLISSFLTAQTNSALSF